MRCRHCNKDSSRKVVHNLKNAKFNTENKLQERKAWYGKCRQPRTSSLRQTRAIINKQEKDNLNRKRHSQAEGENQNKQKRQIEQRPQNTFPNSRERHTRFAKANGQIVHRRASESAPPVTVDSSKATKVEKEVIEIAARTLLRHVPCGRDGRGQGRRGGGLDMSLGRLGSGISRVSRLRQRILLCLPFGSELRPLCCFGRNPVKRGLKNLHCLCGGLCCCLGRWTLCCC